MVQYFLDRKKKTCSECWEIYRDEKINSKLKEGKAKQKAKQEKQTGKQQGGKKKPVCLKISVTENYSTPQINHQQLQQEKTKLSLIKPE